MAYLLYPLHKGDMNEDVTWSKGKVAQEDEEEGKGERYGSYS